MSTQINALASHPTMPLLVTGHEDKYIRIFDISTGKLLSTRVHVYLCSRRDRRSMHAFNVSPPRWSNLSVDRPCWFHSGLRWTRRLGAILGYSRIKSLRARHQRAQGESEGGSTRGRISSIAAIRGERGGRRCY